MTKSETIAALKLELKYINEFQKMLSTTDHLGCLGQAKPSQSMINLEVCWQQSPGSKNYHSSIESPFKDRLTKAACHHALTLLRWADVDCQQELDKVRMSRKEELEQELKEIQEMSLTDGE